MTKQMIIKASEEGWYIKGKLLVECKDCKYWIEGVCTKSSADPFECTERNADDFCSRGEKR